jgi:16S rRNA processing protein RimM
MGKETEGLVLVGKVSGVHSLRGEIKVFPYAGEAENFLCYERLLLLHPQQETLHAYRVLQARMHKERVIVHLKECTSRSQAEDLVHAEVYVPEEDLPEPGADEFYLREVEGKQMLTESGQVLGTITGLLLGTGQVVAQVQGQEQEYLIPLVPAFLLALDDKVVRVRLPPGLLEINA